MQKPKVIVLGGPTASGKTALAIEIAKSINGEIISADSMQIYKEMNIGTAKPDEKEKQGIPHHMMDFVSPNIRYSVADYKKQAKDIMKQIIEKGKVPIVVGGTGLYIDSLIYEIEFLEIETDLQYRKKLEEIVEKEGLEKLYNEAKKIDSDAMEKISKNDKKRILRVLEIYHQTGKTKTELDRESKKEPEFDYKVFAITMNREVLYDRINKRVDIMLEKGLVEEVENIYKKYKEFPTAMQALGYKEVVEYLENKISKDEMIEKIKRESRRYAKRQLTWFRKNQNIIWINGEDTIQYNKNLILEEIKNSEEGK